MSIRDDFENGIKRGIRKLNLRGTIGFHRYKLGEAGEKYWNSRIDVAKTPEEVAYCVTQLEKCKINKARKKETIDNDPEVKKLRDDRKELLKKLEAIYKDKDLTIEQKKAKQDKLKMAIEAIDMRLKNRENEIISILHTKYESAVGLFDDANVPKEKKIGNIFGNIGWGKIKNGPDMEQNDSSQGYGDTGTSNKRGFGNSYIQSAERPVQIKEEKKSLKEMTPEEIDTLIEEALNIDEEIKILKETPEQKKERLAKEQLKLEKEQTEKEIEEKKQEVEKLKRQQEEIEEQYEKDKEELEKIKTKLNSKEIKNKREEQTRLNEEVKKAKEALENATEDQKKEKQEELEKCKEKLKPVKAELDKLYNEKKKAEEKEKESYEACNKVAVEIAEAESMGSELSAKLQSIEEQLVEINKKEETPEIVDEEAHDSVDEFESIYEGAEESGMVEEEIEEVPSMEKEETEIPGALDESTEKEETEVGQDDVNIVEVEYNIIDLESGRRFEYMGSVTEFIDSYEIDNSDLREAEHTIQETVKENNQEQEQNQSKVDIDDI